MEPAMGDEALCAMCGERIVYVGPYWSHIGAPQPRHPAVPKEEKQSANYPEYIVATPDAALVTNTDWLRIWLNGMAATHKRLVAVYHIPSTWQPVFIFEDTSE